jgi:uncharacterized membrane protein
VKAVELFSEKQIAAIEAAIKDAERSTSGELRLYIEDHCEDKEVLDRAAFLFDKLKMHETAKRNGVLIYLAVADHRFAIIGDAGINAVVPADFWNTIKEDMLQAFKKGAFEEGLIAAITASGKALSKHFPFDGHTDTNELSDEIIIK